MDGVWNDYSRNYNGPDAVSLHWQVNRHRCTAAVIHMTLDSCLWMECGMIIVEATIDQMQCLCTGR